MKYNILHIPTTLKAISFCLFFTIAVNLKAQKRDISKLSDDKKAEVAQQLLENGSYYNAIPLLKELVLKDSTKKKYIFKLAEAYYKARDYKNAEKWYPKLKEYDAIANKQKNKGKSKPSSDAPQVTAASFHYAECLKYNGKYEQAREAFQLFANSGYRDPKGMNLKLLAKQEIKSCEYAAGRRTSDVDVDIVHMGDNINSGYSDFSPSLKDDNTLIFSSFQSDTIITLEYGERHSEHVKLFESDYSNGAWGDPKELSKLNANYGHTANGSFSPDGKRFYFSKCKNKSNTKISCQIYVSKVDSGEFSAPVKLSGGINHQNHSSTMPVVGRKQGKGKSYEEVLYFASDMKGTFGGMDIWYASFDKEGNLNNPINCGKNINTIKDEITPYYDNDASYLYFSSNYHPGFGGHDVFKAKGWGSKFQKPENLKMPVNTSYDDTYYTLLPENKLKGFVVSNRPGGRPLVHETCCDDIWEMDYKIPTILIVNALDSATMQPIKDAITVKAGKYDALDDSLYDLDASIDFDTMFTNDDKHFLKVIGTQDKLDEYFIIGGKKKVIMEANSAGYNYSKASFLTDSLSLPIEIKADSLSNIKSEVNKNIVRISLLLSKGNRKATDLVQGNKGEKKDTIKVASSLKQEFNKTLDGPKVDVFKEEPSGKVVQEMDFTINLSFEYKTIALTGTNQSTLDSLVTILKKNPRLSISFTTHTDAIGSDEYNMNLSIQRATFIANSFIKSGINRRRIKSAKGLGERAPMVKETKSDGSDDPDARRLNRRTEIRLFLE